jgi:aminomethyltransferase
MRCAGVECTVSRTGYTGELGYEIMAPGGALPTLAEALLAHEAVRPAGLGARDSLRLEMGYPLYGHELSVARNPLEAGLEMFLALGPEREFVGAKALRAVHDAGGPVERLVAFRAETRRRTNNGDAILCQGAPGGRGAFERVGTVTSGAFSPTLEVSIGMGYVRADVAKLGTELTVATGRAEVAATVCDKPIYTGGTCRTKTRSN